MTDLQKSRILDFIKQQKLAVISTIGEHGPESAVVGFGETDELELYFGTSNASRKYKNIQNNPHVAFVIGWDDETHMSVQYEGVAKELAGDEALRIQAQFAAKNPKTVKFLARPDQRYFLVQPTWVRLVSRDETFEITF